MRISDWSSDVCSSDLQTRRSCVSVGTAVHLECPPSSQQLKGMTAWLRSFAYFMMIQLMATPRLMRSEARRVGKECSVRVDLGGRRIINKTKIQLAPE